jgi:hypothetical protein
MNRLTRLSSLSPAAAGSDEMTVSAVLDDIFGFSWDGRSGDAEPLSDSLAGHAVNPQ